MNNKRKTLIGIIVAVFCIAAFITLFILFGQNEEVITSFQFEENIVVTDGVADIGKTEIPFTLEKSGLYTMYTEWSGDEYAIGDNPADGGMITGLVVYSPAGEEVFCVTGESVKAESVEIGMAAGDYIAQYRYLTNEEALQALIAETGAKEYDKEEYVYATDAVYEMEYHFTIRQADGRNIFLVVGLITGVCVGLVVVAIVLVVTKDDKKMELKYDERQIQERGTAFKLGFFTQLLYMSFLCLCYMAGIKLPVDTEVVLFFGILLSTFVYVIYCIWKEAYISLNENVKKVNIAFVIIGIVNIFIGVMHCMQGDMIEDGILTFRCMNLMCGIFILIVAIIIGCVELAKKREDD
ncbi:MAG: hypothetical protein ACI4EQ_06420 [Lachnospiraceae bacterium]